MFCSRSGGYAMSDVFPKLVSGDVISAFLACWRCLRRAHFNNLFSSVRYIGEEFWIRWQLIFCVSRNATDNRNRSTKTLRYLPELQSQSSTWNERRMMSSLQDMYHRLLVLSVFFWPLGWFSLVSAGLYFVVANIDKYVFFIHAFMSSLPFIDCGTYWSL